MTFAKFQDKWFKIDREIAENYAIPVDDFKFNRKYRSSILLTRISPELKEEKH